MLDFLTISEKIDMKKGIIEIYPNYKVGPSKDLMVRAGDFYAIWDEDNGKWSTNGFRAIAILDKSINDYYESNKNKYSRYADYAVHLRYPSYAENDCIDKWRKFCKKQMEDNYKPLDEKLVFANTPTKREDYSSKSLPYPLEQTDIQAYDKIMSTLYTEEERHKLEWGIGSIVTGDSKKLQKFFVLYGSAGTGKSTVINIITQLFDGYCASFCAKDLGSKSNAFALEPFKTNPLVAYEHDGDLSRIEDNTTLNSLISHEKMPVNEKFKSIYEQSFKATLFVGSNKPVKITDAKSGLLRRLIDVSPSGNTIPISEYNALMARIPFELSGIAWHCKSVYEADKKYYNNYVPTLMLGASNDFYNFVMDSYDVFEEADFITLKQAWMMYKEYVEDAKVPYPFSKRAFQEELKNYFDEYYDRLRVGDGDRVRSVYKVFKLSKAKEQDTIIENKGYKIDLNTNQSLFDKIFADCPAQYARLTDSGSEVPSYKWSNVKTTLKDLETWKVHYVKVPENLVIIDFDLKNEKGEKDREKNLEAASKWPPTYTELSKGGNGVHLHYYYTGDIRLLSAQFDENIEIKTFPADKGTALRRKVSMCNDLQITTLNSGLPLREMKGESMVSSDRIRSERGLRTMIESCLNKEHHGYTKPEMDFIKKILDDAYDNGLKYDISDMRNDIINFALGSSNQSEYCLRLVDELKFKSAVDNDFESKENVVEEYMKKPIIFFDCEVFPNLFLINWKEQGEGKKIFRMINPKPHEVLQLEESGRLVGFNCRAYDNHMLQGCEMGFTNQQLFDLSQRLVSKDKTISRRAKFGTAFNKSYTDIFDYAVKRQSLKKWEIDLGIHHLELGLPWDQPVPEEKWKQVAEYCDNDVISTEAVWNATKSDFKTRQILADIAGMTVNDTTNSLIERIVFGQNKHPQTEFNYRKMWEKPEGKYFTYEDAFDYAIGKTDKLPEGKVWFREYKFWFEKEGGKQVAHSSYRDVDNIGEGGYVYSEPGIWFKIKTQDVSGQHPASLRAERLLGDYTDTYGQIVDARLAIKHKDFEAAKSMLDGKLAPYLDDPSEAADMAKALKLVVNRVYGQTFTAYDNPFRDPKNLDNIVAKRGSLFMIDLRNAVQSLGFKVIHCKTDSIKIPYITPELITFIRRFGKCYGYTFETEEEYERLCLVNKAVYIAKTEKGEWTATGTEFKVPYIFKTLFTHEPIKFEDLCETKSTDRGGAIYLDMNEDLPDVSWHEDITKKIRSLRTSIEKTKASYKNVFDDEKLVAKFKTFDRKYGSNFASGDVDLSELDRIYDSEMKQLEKGHEYKFVGKVGQFCPIMPGHGGGELVRRADNGLYSTVTGASGFRWLESEVVRDLGMTDIIDISYYDQMAANAKADISKLGDYEAFANGAIPEYPKLKDHYIDGINIPYPIF